MSGNEPMDFKALFKNAMGYGHDSTYPVVVGESRSDSFEPYVAIDNKQEVLDMIASNPVFRGYEISMMSAVMDDSLYDLASILVNRLDTDTGSWMEPFEVYSFYYKLYGYVLRHLENRLFY